ncbi:MAG TPA: WbqC family protein [Ilumatobacter sp.]|nr:WbqC family protein [Ilumatobacter sp.]
MTRVAIVQSNYIPWKGYFDLLDSVDEFVLYDTAQYTRRDWRNRNQIKTPHGPQWLTVPVQAKGQYLQAIRDTRIDGTGWAAAHWRAIHQNYARAAYFADFAHELRALYLDRRYVYLSELNAELLGWVAGQLGTSTRVTSSADYAFGDGRSERLLDICRQAGADVYVSGPAARDYLDEAMFAAAGIGVEWFEYPEYPDYPQLWGEFTHQVTVLDVLFNCGPAAPDHALLNRHQALHHAG